MPTTTLQVAFVSESADYHNTFGWYNKVTGVGGILFSNVNTPTLAPGTTTTFTVNTADLANIQYFLIPDGADHNDTGDLTGAIKVIQLSNGTWAVADVDSSGNVIYIHGKPDTLEGTGANALFTETSKNAGGVDYASSIVGHTQTAGTLAGDTADGATGQIAWEDQAAVKHGHTYGPPGDADYNDAVFNVTILPPPNQPPQTNPVAASGNEDTTISIALAGSDVDGTVTSFRITSLAANGTLYSDAALTHVIALNGTVAASGNAATVYFVPNANFHGSSAFQYASIDNGGAQDGTPATASITVNSVNDAPAGANHTVTANEDVAYTFATSDFGFTDPNDTPANALLAVKITTVPGAGTLLDNGVAVTAGQFVSAADIAGGLLKFVPAANASGTAYASFTFQVQDNGGTAAGGVDLDQSPNTMTVNVTSVNDAPAGADNTVATLEDTNYVFSAANFGFTDPNDTPANAFQAVKITTIPGAGTLRDNGVAVVAGQFVSLADINAGLLVFTPGANGNGTGYASFTFQVQDNGGTAAGGVDLDQSPNTMTINVTAVNDAPSFTVGATQTVAEDSGAHSISNFATGISAGPADESGQTVNFIVSNNNAAMFSVAPSISPTGTLTYTTAANFAGTATVTVQLHDNGGTANGGADTSAVQTFVIDASPVADTPTYTADFTPKPFTVPSTASSNEFQVTTTNSAIPDQGSAVAGLVDSQGKHAGFVVVWLEQPDPDDSSTARIVGQRYDDNGNAVNQDGTTAGAGQFDISDTSGAAPANTNSVSAMPDGGFLVTWTAQDQNGPSGDDIQGRIVSATGVLGDIFVIADPAKQLQTESNSVFANGDFVVVSEKIVGAGDGDIVFQRFTSSGTTVTAQGGLTVVNSVTADVQDNQDVATLSDAAHRFVTVWQSDSTLDDDPSGSGVYMRLFNFSDGSAVTSDIRVNTTTADAQSHANVVGLANGNFAVTWTSFNQVSGTSSGDIYLKIFNDAGTQVVGETLVNTTTADLQDTPEITQLADGGFLVQWISVNQDGVGDPSGVYAQRFDASGNKVGTEFMVPSNGSGNQAVNNNFGHEGLSMLADGKAVFTWFDPDAVSAEPEARIFVVPGLGQETAPIRLAAVATAVTDTVGTNVNNGGIETEQVFLQFTLGAGDTITLTDGTGPHTLTFNTAGAQSADVTGWNYATITATPTGFTGAFSINAHIVVTDQATLSTGLATDIHTEDHAIPIFIIPAPDPVFVADNAGPVDLHLSHISAASTATITAAPDNGSLLLADGTAVHTGATLTSAELAGLTFVPKDVSGEASSTLSFTVSDGATSSSQNIPIHVVDSAAGGVTLTGTEDKDVLAGGPGHDILNGNGGTDFMTGGGGADTFVFNQVPQQNAPLTHVTDYSAAQGDVFDFSALHLNLAASSQGGAPPPPSSSPSSSFSSIHINEDASGTFATVQVDIGTSGSHQLVDIAVLDGVHNGDAVDVMVSPDSIVHLHANWIVG